MLSANLKHRLQVKKTRKGQGSIPAPCVMKLFPIALAFPAAQVQEGPLAW